MTIAEEFGHVLLHKEAIEKVKSAEDFKTLQNHGDWDKHDRNAKRLAAALLMPAKNVLDDSRILYEQMVSLVGYNNPEAIKKQIAHKLSERYEVSVASMRFRLNEWPINVIDKIDNAMRDSLDFLD
jgi:Zn-dependent peptidase ImmA (M78 family)